RKDILYLQALRWQEKAERAQARLNRLAPGKGAAGGVKDRPAREAAQDAWNDARASWAQYKDANPVTPALIKGRVEEAMILRATRDTETAMNALDQLARDLRRSLTAQALHARALGAADRRGEAVTALRGLLSEAKVVTTSKELQGVRGDIAQTVPEQ